MGTISTCSSRRLARNEHTVRTWLKAYQAAGPQGLENTPQSGRPATKGLGKRGCCVAVDLVALPCL
jgi:hypothetical protein